ncbi:site-specific integrase [Spirosoma spitsbergense]|uniref:site-specific integrase n=1 Tax=Spirosoma spitsbergense TaxID=431554 RepID=UPI0003680919|nr:site-specific integrase [Spirosoma spitsbergense]
MEIARTLRLDRAGSDGSVSIHLRCCWQGYKVRLSSGEKVKPADWDEKKGVVKGRVKFASDINTRLDTYETGLKKFAYQTQNAGNVLTVDMVRAEVERIRTQELGHITGKTTGEPAGMVSNGVPSLAAFLATYEREAPGGLSKSTAYQIAAIRSHLDAFMPGIDWADLRINTLNQLKNYWSEEIGLADNSISAYFGSLRGALKYALAQQYPVPGDYALVSGRASEVIRPALTRSHLAKLEEVSLPDGKHIQAVHWLFQMACYTGLRHSDLGQIRASGIRMVDNHPCLMALQQKAAGTIALPLTETAVALLEKQPEGYPVPALRQYNEDLKRIGQSAGINEPVSVSSRYNGKLLHSVIPLCDTLTSHTARRTFASLLVEGGLNTRLLQQLMGHSSLSSTEKYIRLPSQVVLTQTLDAWKKTR